MTQRSVHWRPLIGGMVATLATVVVLGGFDLGAFEGIEEYGFGLLVLLACVLAWLISRIIIEHYERLIDHAPRFFRFALVGFVNTLVDLGVLNILLFFFTGPDGHARIFPVLATISFIVVTINSYCWNRYWAFKGSDALDHKASLSRFFAITLVSFAINVGISSFLVWLNPLPVIPPTVWANISKLVATGFSLLLNFIGYHNFVFKHRR